MKLLLNHVFFLTASVMTSAGASQPRAMRTIFNFNSEDQFSASGQYRLASDWLKLIT